MVELPQHPDRLRDLPAESRRGTVASAFLSVLAAMVITALAAPALAADIRALGFRVTALDRIDRALVFESAGEDVRILPPRHRRSELIEAAVGSRIPFYEAAPRTEQATPPAPGGSAARTRLRREPVAIATIPSGIRRPLLLFEQAPSRGEGQFNVFVIDDSWAAHAAGTVRVLNLSTLPMAASVSETEFSLDPGKMQVARLPDPDATHLRLQVALNVAGNWKVDYDGVHQVLPKMRFLAVCRAVQKPDGEIGLRVDLLRDFEPPSARISQDTAERNPAKS